MDRKIFSIPIRLFYVSGYLPDFVGDGSGKRLAGTKCGDCLHIVGNCRFSAGTGLPGFLVDCIDVLMVLQKKIKLILVILILGIVLNFVFSKFMTTPQTELLTTSFRGVVKVEDDATGSWRIRIQKSAFHQALKTFWLGQGYGGYFNFYIPETGKTEAYPPHNQYTHLVSENRYCRFVPALHSVCL